MWILCLAILRPEDGLTTVLTILLSGLDMLGTMNFTDLESVVQPGRANRISERDFWHPILVSLTGNVNTSCIHYSRRAILPSGR